MAECLLQKCLYFLILISIPKVNYWFTKYFKKKGTNFFFENAVQESDIEKQINNPSLKKVLIHLTF